MLRWITNATCMLMISMALACATQNENAIPTEPTPAQAASRQAAELLEQADRAAAAGRSTEALGLYGEAATLDPESARARIGLGDMYRVTGRDDLAIIAYRRAIDVDRRAVQAYVGLAEIFRAQGRTRDAVTQYLRAVAFEPASLAFNSTLATLYLELNSPSEAIIFARRARELAPDSPATALLLARALSQASDHRAALSLFQEVETRQTLGLEDLLKSIDAMEALGMNQQAMDLLRKQSYRQHAPAQVRLGRLMLQHRMPAEATVAFDQALAMAPDNVEAHNGKASAAMMLFMMSDRRDLAPLRQAIAQWEQSLELDEQQPRIQQRLGEARAMLP